MFEGWKRNKNWSLTGFEVELLTIDRAGRPIDGGDALLARAEKEMQKGVQKECAHGMIELITNPWEEVTQAMDDLLNQLHFATQEAEKEGIYLLPLGTYPGKFTPTMRKDKGYAIKSKVFGEERFLIAGRCFGFHSHFTLPAGIFDEEIRMLRLLAHATTRDTFVNSYNFLVAADPALTTFMQSSPFYQGKYVGKDSRMIMYRGGKALKSPFGLYAEMEEFGGLPPYLPTVFDVVEIVRNRYEAWKALIKSVGLNIRLLPLYGSILDTAWNPIKINPHGTIETRGMDMNHPIYCGGVAAIIKSVLTKLQTEDFTIVPSEVGIKEPFKVTQDCIYVPPFSHVKNRLQPLAAYEGLASEEVYQYCKRLLDLAMQESPADTKYLFAPLQKMLSRRTTVSDQLIAFAKAHGWDPSRDLTDDIAWKMALAQAKKLHREIARTRLFTKKGVMMEE